MTEQKVPSFEKNSEYKIQLYPKNVFVTGKYLGKIDGTHVFQSKNGSGKMVLVNNHFMTINEYGVITHKRWSSAPIVFGDREKLNSDFRSKLEELTQ